MKGENIILVKEGGALQAERRTIIERRIADNVNRVTESWLDVGRCLNQAEDENLVPHGEWIPWVEKHTGLSIRHAQQIMKAAREVAIGSPLERLGFSKVRELIALPAETREEFAKEHDAENKSVRELKAAIKAQKAAERERDSLQGKLDRMQDEMRSRTQDAAAEIARLKEELAEAESRGADAEEIEELEAEIRRRAKAEEKAKAELLALRAQIARGNVGGESGEGFTVGKLDAATHEFLGKVNALAFMQGQLATCDNKTRDAYRARVKEVEKWCELALRALNTVSVEIIDAVEVE